tara:strand:+ start:1323 stop:2444 length:1122 start_codon:yes stop_codon:yes gene_type:complete
MFCEGCGKELNINDKFCINCGTPIKAPVFAEQVYKEKFPLGKFLLIVAIILGVLYTLYLIATYEETTPVVSDIESVEVAENLNNTEVEDEYSSTMLDEMNVTLEPLGYYNDAFAYEDDSISADEWLSHLVYYPEEKQPVGSSQAKQQFVNQRDTLSAVVKIVCEDDEYFYYGSGTNFTTDGYVLTNFHVVEDVLDDPSCVVGFPDPTSGLIKEVYWATPIVDNEEETGHDLALLSIEAPVFDEELNVYGSFERYQNADFPVFELLDECTSQSTELGQDVFVLGYPPLSGGALTITNGIISSLYSQDGYLVTSAKIVSGNSGGMAVDRNGCYVGVPTAVYREFGSEQFGEIIDAEFVGEFMDAIDDDIEEYLAE